MLVLSRQREEVVMIGDDIEVKVVDIRGDKVHLGFTAPRQVPIHRKEVFDAIEASKNAPDFLKSIHVLFECVNCGEQIHVKDKDRKLEGPKGLQCLACSCMMVFKKKGT